MMPKDQTTEYGHFAQHLIHSNQIQDKYTRCCRKMFYTTFK
jgi:hypothetical protein